MLIASFTILQRFSSHLSMAACNLSPCVCMVKTSEVIVGLRSPVSPQDEQLHRNLHEEINNLALKLEKQGKTESKNISSRRKHINKMFVAYF